ncbi:mitochondrial dicarboxylate carrier-like [Chrysoperla carnea]|uniref:mitochondrial dicarboxylate carrier-like n=1 Tax=Chrysoperla carnea TaxID=189513 RepID=UPI001D093F4B|nr:mitochondrial dicarboxylate carrier-like [Chrysoperla carnea]
MIEFKKCNNEQKTEDKVPPWWAGGAAQALSAIPMHPFDIIKVQFQVSEKLSFIEAIHNITREKGIRGFTYGLSASITRQLLYATARFGIYEGFKTEYKRRDKKVEFHDRVWMSCIAGALGGFIANPPDIVNVRMLNDFVLPAEKRRNYKNVVHGLYTVVNNEGFLGLYKGGTMTMLRACVITMSVFTSYDTFKVLLLHRFRLMDDMSTHFITSVLATTTAIMVSQPVDVIRTRVMANVGQPFLQILKDIYVQNGILGFWKGFLPTYARVGPMNITMYVLFEFFRLNFGYYVEKKEK